MTSITIKYISGIDTIELPNDWTLAMLKNKIDPNKFNNGKWTTGGKNGSTIIWTSEDPQTVAKIKNSQTIWQIGLVNGGTNMFDTLLKDIVSLTAKIPTRLGECVLCSNEDIPCIKIHDKCNCCLVCTQNQLASEFNNQTSLKCFCCKKEDLFKNRPELRSRIITLNLLRSYNRLMHLQIHKCGATLELAPDTQYSKQKCDTCNVFFCFFCARDWDNQKMKNQPFFCGDSCVYKSQLAATGNMKSWRNVSIPEYRFCPNCTSFVQFDEKCKNHQCEECNQWFCFFCLKPSENAGHKGGLPGPYEACPLEKQTLAKIFEQGRIFGDKERNF